MAKGKLRKRIETVCEEIPNPGKLSPNNEVEVIRKLDEIRDLLMKELSSREKIEGTKTRDLAVSLGIVIDKRRLLAGESTENLLMQQWLRLENMSDKELEARTRELEAELAELERDPSAQLPDDSQERPEIETASEEQEEKPLTFLQQQSPKRREADEKKRKG